MLPGGYGIMPASYPMNAGPDTNDAPLFQDNLMTAYLRAGRTGANWEVLPASASGTAYRVYALLSLANAVFPGARYLFIGCEGDDDRGDEMLFGDLACAGGINPAFTTRRCMLLGKRYYIVEISDSCSKPFMLAAGVNDSGRTLSPGVVYVHTPVPAGDGIRQATQSRSRPSGMTGSDWGPLPPNTPPAFFMTERSGIKPQRTGAFIVRVRSILSQ